MEVRNVFALIENRRRRCDHEPASACFEARRRIRASAGATIRDVSQGVIGVSTLAGASCGYRTNRSQRAGCKPDCVLCSYLGDCSDRPVGDFDSDHCLELDNDGDIGRPHFYPLYVPVNFVDNTQADYYCPRSEDADVGNHCRGYRRHAFKLDNRPFRWSDRAGGCLGFVSHFCTRRRRYFDLTRVMCAPAWSNAKR